MCGLGDDAARGDQGHWLVERDLGAGGRRHPEDDTVLVAQHLAEGMPEAQIRAVVLAELRANLPEETFEEYAWETGVAGWQRAVDVAMGESR